MVAAGEADVGKTHIYIYIHMHVLVCIHVCASFSHAIYMCINT